MTATFAHGAHGKDVPEDTCDIGEVRRRFSKSREFEASLGLQVQGSDALRDLYVRLGYTAAHHEHASVVNWLNALGEAPFGRQTPDGYPLVESGWAKLGTDQSAFRNRTDDRGGNGGLFDPRTDPARTPAFHSFQTGCTSRRLSHFYRQTPAPRWIALAPSSSETRSAASPDSNYRAGSPCKRRTFLRMMTLAMPALTLTGKSICRSAGLTRFLRSSCRGGYDCANVVVPTPAFTTRDAAQHRHPEAHRSGGGRRGRSGLGLVAPPALRSSIAPLYARREGHCSFRSLARMTCREAIRD